MAGEALAVRAIGAAAEATRALVSPNGLKVAGALAVGVGGTSYLVGEGANKIGNGVLKAGVGLGIAYLVYRALKK